jgi:hypothetical protein
MFFELMPATISATSDRIFKSAGEVAAAEGLGKTTAASARPTEQYRFTIESPFRLKREVWRKAI